MNFPNEEWRDIPGFPGYQASNLGRIKSQKRPLLGNYYSATGYQQYSLMQEGKRRNVRGHTLVALAFLGLPPNGHHVCHCDGNGANNRLFNLRYATPKDNAEDRIRHGTHARGERNPAAKLTSADIIQIRNRRTEGELTAGIAKDYNISPSLVSMICLGQRWAHIAGPLTRKRNTRS